MLPTAKHFKTLISLSCLLFLSLGLEGCNDSKQSNKKSFSIQKKIQKFSQKTTLKGKVSNGKRVKSSGEIKVTDSKGQLIASTKVSKGNHYSVVVPADTELPIILTFEADKESENQDKLISVVVFSAIKKYDINELTTLIAKKAKSLGGYTHINMVLAADSTVGIPDANKTTTGFKGDPTTQYGGWH